MVKTIFEIENRLNIQKEFDKFISILHNNTNLIYTNSRAGDNRMSYVSLIDKVAFKKWRYRDTFITVEEYLENIGIDKYVISGSKYITEEIFLYYLEFIKNMTSIVLNEDVIYKYDESFSAILDNMKIILEKMNYMFKKVEDKYIITKRDSDVDSILDKVPQKISEVLLEYNDFRNKDDIEEKKKILKKLDLYIEENKKIILGIDSKLVDSIGTIVNEMGVNHPINKEPYISLRESELIEWYDKCFLLMIHAIRTTEVNDIKKQRQELVKN